MQGSTQLKSATHIQGHLFVDGTSLLKGNVEMKGAIISNLTWIDGWKYIQNGPGSYINLNYANGLLLATAAPGSTAEPADLRSALYIQHDRIDAKLPVILEQNVSVYGDIDIRNKLRLAYNIGCITAGDQSSFMFDAGDFGDIELPHYGMKFHPTKYSGVLTTPYCMLSAFEGVKVITRGVDQWNISHSALTPGQNNTNDLGSADKRFKDIYCTNDLNTTSDERLKTDIQDSELGLQFINSLRPVEYKWKEGKNDQITTSNIDSETGNTVYNTENVPIAGVRKHLGLIAQELEVALDEHAGSAGDYAMWCLSDKNDPNSQQSLRYQQLLAPIIKSIQQLSDRLDDAGI